MEKIVSLWHRVCFLFNRKRMDQDLQEEMCFHLERKIEEKQKDGLSDSEAQSAALRAFGNPTVWKEKARDQWGWTRIQSVGQDVRYSLRTMRENPLFTTVAVLSLAIGIGAGTAVFSLVNAILLRSLPVPNPHELRLIQWTGKEPQIDNFSGTMLDQAGYTTGDSMSYPLFLNLREQCASQADIFGYSTLYSATVRARREAFIAEGMIVSDNFFSTLGVRAHLGRLPGVEEGDTGAPPITIISHSLWEREYGLDPAIVGQSIRLNGRVYTIQGVLPAEFSGIHMGNRTDFFVPMSALSHFKSDRLRSDGRNWWIQLLARIKPGNDEKRFLSAIDLAFARWNEGIMKNPKVILSPGHGGPDYHRNSYRKPLFLLLGIVAMVLLAACANLAGISLARGEARRHELAIRSAIGAGRWRLIRQALTEGLLLAVLGATLGTVFAYWLKSLLLTLLDKSSTGLSFDTSLDLRVLGFTAAITLVTALLVGLLPAWRAGRIDPSTSLKERSGPGSSRSIVGKALVSAQIALSLLLLVGAGLFLRTLINLVNVQPGFAVENLLLFRVDPRSAGYKNEQTSPFYQRLQEELGRLPGVRAVTLLHLPLLSGVMSGGGGFVVPGAGTSQSKPNAHRLTISETFFSTMGIPILQGRGFRESDTGGSTKVVVINQAFARKYLPDQDPIGRTIHIPHKNTDWQIVGLCGDARYTDIKLQVPPTFYYSYRQDPISSTFFALRTQSAPLSLGQAVRRTVAGLDPDVPVSEIQTQEWIRDRNIGQERLFAALCSSLAMVAVLLSCIGLYGLLAYTVSRSTRDIGLRIALGAQSGQVARAIVGKAFLLAMMGIVVGLPSIFLSVQWIHSYLYEVEPFDPFSLAISILLLSIAVVLGAYFPAQRAARIDPIIALRCE